MPTEHDVQEVLPSLDWYLPAAHGRQAVEFAALMEGL